MRSTEGGYPWLAKTGPLGANKIRRQLGRSIKLEASGGKTRAEVLVFTGADAPDNFDLDYGDALASTCTITLAVIQQNVGADEPEAVIEGVVEWGTDGTSAAARFDWLNGGVVVVSGSSFKVSAELLTIPEGRSVDVGAFIGYYTVPCCTARLTRVVAAPSILPIAHMSHAVLVQTDDATGAVLQFMSNSGGTLPLFGPHTVPAGPVGEPVPIPPGAASVVVTPVGAGPVPVSFLLTM